jgi:hypothetical protein
MSQFCSNDTFDLISSCAMSMAGFTSTELDALGDTTRAGLCGDRIRHILIQANAADVLRGVHSAEDEARHLELLITPFSPIDSTALLWLRRATPGLLGYVLHAYDQQCADGEGWRDSIACLITDRILSVLVEDMPHYEQSFGIAFDRVLLNTLRQPTLVAV